MAVRDGTVWSWWWLKEMVSRKHLKKSFKVQSTLCPHGGGWNTFCQPPPKWLGSIKLFLLQSEQVFSSPVFTHSSFGSLFWLPIEGSLTLNGSVSVYPKSTRSYFRIKWEKSSPVGMLHLPWLSFWNISMRERFLEYPHEKEIFGISPWERDGSIRGRDLTPHHHFLHFLSWLKTNFLPWGEEPDKQKNWNKITAPRGGLKRHQTYERRMQMCTWARGRSASWAVKEIVMASIMPLHSYWPPPAVQGILVQMNLNRPHKLFHSLQTDCNHRVAAIIMWRSHEWAVGKRTYPKKGFCEKRGEGGGFHWKPLWLLDQSSWQSLQ